MLDSLLLYLIIISVLELVSRGSRSVPHLAITFDVQLAVGEIPISNIGYPRGTGYRVGVGGVGVGVGVGWGWGGGVGGWGGGVGGGVFKRLFKIT